MGLDDTEILLFMLQQTDLLTKTLVAQYTAHNDKINDLQREYDMLERRRQHEINRGAAIEAALIARYRTIYDPERGTPNG